jgi:hypothetical protein
MNSTLKAIQKKIDDLINQAENGDITLTDDTLELLNEVINYANLAKLKDKTQPIADLLTKLDALLQTISEGRGEPKENTQAIVAAIQALKLDVAAPQVNVEPPKVSVTVPPIKVPPAEVILPEEMVIKKPSWVSGLVNLKPIIDAIQDLKKSFPKLDIKWPTLAKNPISVRLSDGEKFYRALGGGGSSGGFSVLPKVAVPAKIDQLAVGEWELVPAQGEKLKIKVITYVFTLSQDGTAKFKGTEDLSGAMDILASGGVVAVSKPEAPLLETGPNESLSIVTTGGLAKGHMTYIVEN